MTFRNVYHSLGGIYIQIENINILCLPDKSGRKQLSLPKKDKRSVGSTKVCIEYNPMIKELKKFIVNRPKTTSKNVEDECDHLVEEVLAAKHWKLSVEWEEIIISEIKPKPKLERPQLELLKKYTLDNTKDLRKVLAEPFVWCTQSKA
ncbi:21357_t:CDS:2 [Rhizophagus irregularis]|nr:21357_t:CDS:2 [Rhizophagus irregularis]